MNSEIIEHLPELYAKAKPYIDVLESLGFTQETKGKLYFAEEKYNYEHFNKWVYKNPITGGEDYVADLLSYTGDLKVEVYKFKILPISKKQLSYMPHKQPFMLKNDKIGEFDSVYESVVVDNLDDFKKELGNYLKVLKKYQEKVRKYALEKDFSNKVD